MLKGKRAAIAAPANASKKAKRSQQPTKAPSPPSDDEDFEDASSSSSKLALNDDDEDDEEEGDFKDLEDDEENEFELQGEAEESDDDDEMIGDDGADLYANLGAAGDADMDDDDDDDSEDDEEPTAPVAAPAIKKANVRNSKAPKPLTPAELRALAFAELTASPISNIIATQVTSVLDPITPPPASTSPLQPLLKSLHAHLTSLPKQKAISLAALKKKGSTVPKVEGSDGKWGKMELEWEKPRAEDVRVVGRWAWGAGIKIKGEYLVEMAIAMPESLLQPKDYLSPRFQIKSTHYLVTLSSSLPSSLGPVTLSYVPLPGSQGFALEIRSAHIKGTEKVGLSKIKGAVLRLRIVWPTDAFAASKLSPSSNVVRPASASADENGQVDPSTFPSTPLHSTSLLLSSLPLLTTHLKYHHTLTTTHPSYVSAIRLLQSWASKRSYGASLGFTDDWWAWCVARTLSWGAGSSDPAGAAAGGEAWASWRKTVEWLAGVNWVDGMWFRVEGDKAYEKDEFRKAFKGRPIFVDPTGTVNLAAGIDLSTLEMLKQDAKATIALLLSGLDDEVKFEGAFLRELREVERFDNFARITVPASLLASSSTSDDALDYSDAVSHLTTSISYTLRRALGSRVRAFQLNAPSPTSIPIGGSAPAPSSITLSLGLLVDPVESSRVVDQGPSAEDEVACAEWSAFWGPKSELRRFKDGAIVETVVWDEMGPNGLGPQRNMVVSRIIKYILNHRHGVPAANIEVFAGAMDHLMVEPEAIRRAIYLEDSFATGKGFGNIMNAFDDLAKFERFPDSIKYISTHDILLTLESSGRWPDDLEGVQKIKAAFLTKIGAGLEKNHQVIKAQVAFDLDARPVDDNVSLEILTSSGYAFRAHRRSRIPSLAAYDERFVDAPRHHAAIATLQHHFTSYSHTIRLVKRWFSSHMLLPFFDEELIEILVASIFIDAASPFDPPQSGATGFARVMEKLASWKWRDEALMVPLYTFSTATTSGRRATFPPAQKARAKAAFEKRRLEDGQVNEWAWVVATEEDVLGRVWGRRTDKVVAARARGLAKATLKTLNEGVTSGGLVVEQLFSPPLGDYSFLLHLDSSVNPRHFQSVTPDPKALTPNSRSSVLSGSLMGEMEEDESVRLNWDPVAEFVKAAEVRKNFCTEL
ncbi:Nrap protein-domain-containing protein [Leucosporidium creatinivorum]|uniref:U3 small nucleolar RNA-associated protein 22 n=1 Tax=Leucosporidium creatinivorum TaxID=106004 RepID=A0A1Y2G8A4_9BASI|nr:Nrap protein-domain-containing protein [Leucosporidium creatinivorum]